MDFVHCPPRELIELETEMINGKRHYLTPDGKFPSITSVLGSFPKPELYAWRKRVGNDEANKITAVASSRGTKLHLLCEKYLSNEDIVKTQYMPDALASFYSFKTLLNNINNIHKLEVPLYSPRLKVAGRCDAIAEYKGKLSVIDFKTSRREKKEDWIQDYFIQATFYGLSYLELTGIKIENIAILIAVDDGEPQEFVKPLRDFISPLIKKVNYYYKNYH